MHTHNVVFLIGNGFDIQILKSNKINPTTSYQDFYSYLKLYHPNSENILIDKIKEDKKNNKQDWADFENTIGELLKEPLIDLDQLKRDLLELQYYFSDFLNLIMTPQLLKDVDDGAQKNFKKKDFGGNKSPSLNTLQMFLGDLDEEDFKKIKFKSNVKHHDFFKFNFFNFNYTSLFDSYIYLDKNSFDPHKYKTSKNNFHFDTNPNRFKPAHQKDNCENYCQVDYEIFHPHGTQYVPRSMLFGIDETMTNDNKVRYFIKPYWARNELKYSKYLNEANLFVIFGMSIGKSDKSWWKKIAKNVLEGDAELIIYNYSEDISNDVKKTKIEEFLEITDYKIADYLEDAEKKIFVVNFNEKTHRKAFTIEDKN